MRIRFFLIAFFLVTVVLFGTPVFAQRDEDGDKNPVDTCDNSYRETLTRRAWVESKRELEMAQTIILKGTSMLEYGCMKWRLTKLRGWVGIPGRGYFAPPYYGIYVSIGDNALNQAILDTWVPSNFGGNYGGDFYPIDGAVHCNNMNKVWEMARCQDFSSGQNAAGEDVPPPYDQFMTFREIADNDPRLWPVVCDDPALNREIGLEEDEVPDSIENRREKWWNEYVGTYRPAEAPPRGGHPHAIITYLPKIDPENCKDIKPIPTGLTALTSKGEQYPDAVCPAPGCWYKFETFQCKF